jgi:uracil-DNA glycosylase
MNRTLASQTTFGIHQASITRAQLLRKLPRHRRLYERPLPRELAWCKPYVAMMSDLMSRLKVRDRSGER